MSRRAQLVVVAAVVIAVALVPLALAYLQLGYHDDVRASGVDDDPTRDARDTLARAVHDASTDVPVEYRWDRRSAAAQSVRSTLEPRLGTVETARIEEGVARNVTYNRTLAGEHAAAVCPDGPGRDFGPCEAVDGVIVQERAGWTHVLGVAFDVRTTTETERTAVATVVHAVGDGGH